jgi:hypothetical protein
MAAAQSGEGASASWEPLEPANTLVKVGENIWTLNDLEGMKGYVRNRVVLLLLQGTAPDPFIAVINPPKLTEKYVEIVRGLEEETGAKVRELVSHGYKHHLFIPQWLAAFEGSRAHMFGRDASQPEQQDVDRSSIEVYDTENPDTILEPLVTTGEVEVVLHTGVGDGWIPTFSGKKECGPYRYNLWILHKPSKTLMSGCQAWGEGPEETGPEPWLLKKLLGIKRGQVNLWGKILDQNAVDSAYAAVREMDFDLYLPAHGPYLRQAKPFVEEMLARHNKL